MPKSVPTHSNQSKSSSTGCYPDQPKSHKTRLPPAPPIQLKLLKPPETHSPCKSREAFTEGLIKNEARGYGLLSFGLSVPNGSPRTGDPLGTIFSPFSGTAHRMPATRGRWSDSLEFPTSVLARPNVVDSPDWNISPKGIAKTGTDLAKAV